MEEKKLKNFYFSNSFYFFKNNLDPVIKAQMGMIGVFS